MATLDEAFDILDQLKANNDPRYNAARDSLQQQIDAYDAQAAEQRSLSYQPPPGPHQLPTQTDYLRGLTHGDDWQSGQGTVRRALAPVIEYGQGVKDYFFPPTVEQTQQRPYQTQELGGSVNQLGAVTQDWLSGIVQNMINSPGKLNLQGSNIGGIDRMRFDQTYPSAPGGVGDPSGFDRQMALEADARRGSREAILGPARDWIEGGAAMGNIAALSGDASGATGNVAEDFLFTPFPTKQERAEFVPLTREEVGQPSIVAGLNRGDLTGLVDSLEMMGPALATMLTTKNPKAALAMFAPPVFGKTYDEHIKSGKAPEEALELAKKAVIFEVVPELLLWGPFKLVKSPLMAIFASIPAEAASEAITELGYIQDEWRNQGKRFTSEEIIARVKHAAKMGAYMGPALGMSFSMPHLYGAIAKGSPKQVVKILQKHREKMVADGAPAVRIEIIDATIAELNDNTLSPDEHARALKNLESSGALGAVYERPGERTRGSWNIDPLNPAVEGGTVVRNEEQLPDFTDWQTWIENRENAKLDETQVDIPERGAAIFSPTAIIKRLTQENGGRRPSRSQVKQRTIDLINEEVGQHGGLRAAIQALGLSIDEQDAFYDRMLRENKEEIEAWKKGEGKAYTRRAVDGGVYFNSSEVVDEWLAHLNRQRQRGLAINKAPIGKYIRHIIQTFKKGAELDLTVAEATEIVDKLQSRLGRRGSDLATPQAEEAPQVTETPDTSQADLDAATAERQVQERILDEQTSSLERSTFGDTRFAKGPDIDNRRQTAIAKAMAPNKHIRESDLRMNAIQENWEDNKDDLEFRRDYASFKEFEQAEWDLNYDMWIDEVQEAQAEETDTNVTQLEVDPSIEELRAAREATQVQLTQLDEQLASLERDTMGDTRFAKAADLDAAGILNRNVRNDFAKGPYKDIAERADEAEIRARIKRLGNLYGPMGQKRGIEPGDRATAKEQAQNAIDNVDAFEEFMAPFEEQMKTQPARSKTAEGRQEKYAERKGITVAEILSYRDRGKTHPMEKKMSYSFAMDEINRLEEAGEATAEEAEARRRALNDLRNQLGGKMPAGAKRRATEIAYGIGDYANLEAWSYTEAETTSMEERAELARGKERVRGLSRTEKTEQELEEITGTDVTPTEMLQIASMAEVEVFDHLKSDEARLQYLREKEAMPASERDALDAFMKDIKGWNQEAYEAQVAAELEAQVEKVGVTKVEQTPTQRKAELKEMKEAQAPIEKRKHVQVEPDFFDSLLDTNFTTQGEAVPDGFMELTEEGEWSEVDDTDTGTRYAKAPDVKQFNEDGGAQSYKDGIDDIILQAIDDGLSYEDFHSLVTAYLNEKVGPTGTVNEKASFTRIQYLRADSELYSHYLGELQYYKEQVDGKKEEVVEKLTATERDNLNREMMSLKATEAEKNQLSWLKKFGANLNRVFGRDFMEVEDIINITRRELVDGEATSDGRVMHGEFIRGERGVRTADNLIIMPLIFHRIKTKFERAHVGLGFQSAQPYVDMVRISKIPEEAAKYGIDSPKDQETIKQFVLFKKALRSEFQKMWDKEDFTYNSLQNAYETALKAAKVKLNLKDPSNLKTFRKDNEVEETEKAIRVMLAVGLRKFTPEMKEMSIDLETGEAQNELVSNRTIQAATDGVVRFAKRSKGDSYEEHFNKSFWYTLTSYLWGKPVQAIRDFNKLSRFRSSQGRYTCSG